MILLSIFVSSTQSINVIIVECAHSSWDTLHTCVFKAFKTCFRCFAQAYESITFVAVAPSLVWNNRRNAGAAIEFAASARKLAPPTRRYSFKTLWTMSGDTKPFSRIGRIDLDMFFNVFCLCMAGFCNRMSFKVGGSLLAFLPSFFVIAFAFEKCTNSPP